MQPERLGRYTVSEKIGSGGMGTVYSGTDADSGTSVALKVLSGSIVDEVEKFRRFEQEVTALSRLEHPAIVRLLGPIEKDGEFVFFPMELLEGETLSARLRTTGPMPVPAALEIIRPLLDGLGAAHEAGVVHRDIKPSNIILGDAGVKVTDFGLARMDDITRLTSTGQLMGTLDYMSPEQCEGAGIDSRSDLYSAGIVLYEMLIGRPPFKGESPGAVLKGHLQDTPPRIDSIRADLPEGLADIVAKLLEKKPAERFPDVASTLEALQWVRDPSRTVTFHAGEGPVIDATTAAHPTRSAAEARRAWVLPAGILLVAVLALLFVINRNRNLRRGATSPPPPAAGRASPEETLATIHEALMAKDFEVFAACFEEPALVGYLSETPERDFAERVATIADFAYRMELPLRNASVGEYSMRVGSSAGLAKVLGLNPSTTLRVAFRHGDEGFRIARVEDDTRGGRGPGGGGGPGGGRGGGGRQEMEKRMLLARVREIFKDSDQGLKLLLARFAKNGRPDREAYRLKIEELVRSGRVDVAILEEECTWEPGRAEIVVRSTKLARAMGMTDDRFVLEFTKSLRDRRWKPRAIRAHEN